MLQFCMTMHLRVFLKEKTINKPCTIVSIEVDHIRHDPINISEVACQSLQGQTTAKVWPPGWALLPTAPAPSNYLLVLSILLVPIATFLAAFYIPDLLSDPLNRHSSLDYFYTMHMLGQLKFMVWLCQAGFQCLILQLIPPNANILQKSISLEDAVFLILYHL